MYPPCNIEFLCVLFFRRITKHSQNRPKSIFSSQFSVFVVEVFCEFAPDSVYTTGFKKFNMDVRHALREIWGVKVCTVKDY